MFTIRDLPAVQRDIDDMIMSVGGYWPPSAAAVRLLEELGEFSEIYPPASGVHLGIGGELADLYIITACIANQLLVALPEIDVDSVSASSPIELLREMVIRAGRIARIVNYYDGPKLPRTMEGWEGLESAIIAFHRSLGRIALAVGISIEEAVADKLAVASGRDRGRFPVSIDPATSDLIDEFADLPSSEFCPYATNARVWGATKCAPGTLVAEYVRESSRDFARFLRCAPAEKLDGFIFGFEHSAIPSIPELSDLLREFLQALNSQFSSSSCFRDDVRVPGWQFDAAGVRLFVSVFSSAYDPTHVRYSPGTTFVFLQPEDSFAWHSIGHRYPGSEMRHRKVRKRFAEAGYWYPSELIDRRIEADLYLLPPSPDAPPVIWWP